MADTTNNAALLEKVTMALGQLLDQTSEDTFCEEGYGCGVCENCVLLRKIKDTHATAEEQLGL